MATPKEVAERMLKQFDADGCLSQASAVALIGAEFGTEFIKDNRRRGAAIDRHVLKEFRKLTKHTAVWVPRLKHWEGRLPEEQTNGRKRY
jgi:hypothetical protein